MEFLSELEKKITDAGKDIARKVKDISEVSRLYTVIAGEQKNITDNYIKLGKEYYTHHADESAQGELTHYCELIRVSLETIEQCRKQIAVLKGQQICDSCGAQVSLDSVFCPKCGAKMPEQPVEEPEEDIEVTTEEPEEEALANEDTEEGAANAKPAIAHRKKPPQKLTMISLMQMKASLPFSASSAVLSCPKALFSAPNAAGSSIKPLRLLIYKSKHQGVKRITLGVCFIKYLFNTIRQAAT